MNRMLAIGVVVLGAILVALAPVDHYLLRIRMDHLASGLFGLGVVLVVVGVGLLTIRRSAAA